MFFSEKKNRYENVKKYVCNNKLLYIFAKIKPPGSSVSLVVEKSRPLR